MRRMVFFMATVLFSFGTAHAQTTISPPALGTTSPLGVPGSSIVGGTGLTLGATEVDPGGLSPAISANCNAAGSGTAGASLGMSSTFDGGGSTATGSALSTSGCASSLVAPTGTASPLSTPGSSDPLILNGGTIPLGTTEIANAGISPLIGAPLPVVVPPTSTTVSPCNGITTSSGAAGSVSTSTSESLSSALSAQIASGC